MSLSLDAAIIPQSRMTPLLATARRYAISASGPLATSAAHFLASLLFVRNLPAAGFGLFSFVLVIVPFAMSLTASLLVIPVTRSLGEEASVRSLIVAHCLKMNMALTLVTMLCVFGLLAAAHAPLLPALLFALFGGLFTFRWFGRCYAFVEGRVGAAIASDLIYGAALMLGLGVLAVTTRITLSGSALVMLLAALAALAPMGRQFFADQFAALSRGSLRQYGAIFRDLTRWSLLGVIFTEATVNAHAYLVTFIAGPGAFALLALGMLLMRPASLVQSALPDLERPVMTRQIAARNWPALSRTAREFGIGLFAVLLATLLLDAVLLHWFPSLVLKRGYALGDVALVATLSALIMAVRALRTPLAVTLQAAGAFKQLAGLGVKSSAISLISTLLLLMAFGPIASLGGVLLGELVILFYCRKLAVDWRAHRG